MKNILRIYRIMLRYSGYLILGLFFMLGFAFFSGVSITMAIPLFDYVFMKAKPQIVYSHFPPFLEAISKVLHDFLHQGNLSEIFSKASLKELGRQAGDILSVTDPILLLWVISITIILLVLFKNIFYYGDKVMFANLRGKMVKTVREMIFRKYLFQTLSFYGKNKVGDSMVRMESDVKIVSNLFIGSAFSAMQDLILLLVHTIIALLMNPRLFLISLVLLPVFSYILGFMGRKIKKYSRRMQNESSNMFSNVEEILSSMPIVKAFVREKHELKKFKTINTKYFNYWRKSLLYSSINIPLSEINSTLMGIMVLMIGGKEVLAPGSSFSYGQFITFLLAIFSMLHPTKNLTRAYADIRKALVSLDRISVILNRELEKLDDPDAIAKKDFTSSIEFRQVSFEYKKNKTVLKDISMQVEKGQKIALVGSSGAGKTTLVNLLPRMYDTKSGEILIDGIEIGNIKLADLRSLFGTVTQDSILFTDTIANNIAYGTLKEITRQDIEKAAQIAYADEFIEKLPLKYDEMLDIRGSNLSGGQRQRLCIARAIVGDPPILIFDEATSALDTEAEQKVQKAIEQATRNRTVFVIAHRLSTVLSSDKIVVIDKGRIIGTGTHQELLNTCTRYETLYNLQFKDNSVS